jgi:hypothetical protein
MLMLPLQVASCCRWGLPHRFQARQPRLVLQMRPRGAPGCRWVCAPLAWCEGWPQHPPALRLPTARGAHRPSQCCWRRHCCCCSRARCPTAAGAGLRQQVCGAPRGRLGNNQTAAGRRGCQGSCRQHRRAPSPWQQRGWDRRPPAAAGRCHCCCWDGASTGRPGLAWAAAAGRGPVLQCQQQAGSRPPAAHTGHTQRASCQPSCSHAGGATSAGQREGGRGVGGFEGRQVTDSCAAQMLQPQSLNRFKDQLPHLAGVGPRPAHFRLHAAAAPAAAASAAPLLLLLLCHRCSARIGRQQAVGWRLRRVTAAQGHRLHHCVACQAAHQAHNYAFSNAQLTAW